MSDMINVRDYGATGDGTTDDRPAFAACQIAAAAANAGIVVPAAASAYRLASPNLTLTQPIALLPGAVIKPDAGVTASFNASVSAGAYKIFDLSAGGSVFIGGSSQNDQLNGAWWGATGDGAADSTTATSQAIAASAESVTPTFFGIGIRQIFNPIITSTAKYLSLLGTGFSYLRWAGAGRSTMLRLSGGLRRAFVDGLWFLMSDATSTVLEIGSPDEVNYGVTLARNTFQGPAARGVLVNSETDEVLWQANHFIETAVGVHLQKSPTVIPNSNHAFVSNYFQNCRTWGVDAERSALLNFYANTHQTENKGGVRLNRQTALTYFGNYHELHQAGSVGLSINAIAGDEFPGGGQVVAGNLFDINAGGDSVGIEIGRVGNGVWVGPNQFFSVHTGIRILDGASQEITIEPQNFNGVATEIDDQRELPSRAFQFNIGAKATTVGRDIFVREVASGALMRTVYKVLIPKEAWRAGASTQEIRIGSTPARSRIVGCFCHTTVKFDGPMGSVELKIGSATGGDQLILAHDVTTAVFKGGADADLGAGLARATAVQGGTGSWNDGNDIYAILTAGSGTLGNGATTNLTSGEVYVYVVMEVMP